MARYPQACRLLEGIEAIAGRDMKERITGDLGTPMPAWSSARKAAWFHQVMGRMDEMLPAAQRRAIRERCACPVSGRMVARHRRMLRESADLAGYARAVRDDGWRGFRADGDTLVATIAEDRCWCRMPRPEGRALSTTYCLCSAGHLRAVFEAVFQRPVQVEIITTLLSGGSDCTFRIDVGAEPPGE